MGGEISTQDLLAQYKNAQGQNGTAGEQQVQFGYAYLQPQHACPNCGYCPCCGRRNVWGAWPYPYYYGPTWVGAGTSLQTMASGGMHVGQTESKA